MNEPRVNASLIRPVRADEWRRWRETRLRMLRDDADFFSTRYEDMVREPNERWMAWIEEAAAGRDKALFVAEESDLWRGVAGGFGRIDPLEVQLVSMWVDPRDRGRGLAHDLIRAIAGWAAGRGSERVVLFVQEANAPARRLYEQAGFLPTGDRALVAAGRSAFKLVLTAPVEKLLHIGI